MTDELFTVPESIDRLAAARRRYEAAEAAPAEYLKITVERIQITDIYVKVLPGTKAKDIPTKLIEQEARKCENCDWDTGPVCIDSAQTVPEKEAVIYSLLDMHKQAVEQAKAELAAEERERMP